MQVKNQQTGTDEAYAPMRIMELELSQPLPTLYAVNEQTMQPYQRAFCLVRLHRQPLGVIELPMAADGLPAEEYVTHIWQHLGQQINEHLHHDGMPAISELAASGLTSSDTPCCVEEREQFLAQAPFVSVIVPTRDRPEQIQRCLQSLMTLHYPRYEIIVVDNAPSTSATADFIRRTYGDVAHVRYICEDRPGRCLALNSGMMAAQGDILAFTDDDVMIDRYWLVELVRGFSRADDVACVTGLVLPLELETPAQFWFEEYCGFSKGFIRSVFDMGESRPKTRLYPYAAGRLGTGANMSFRTTFLRSVGGFDVALGAGSLAQGAEDLAVFFQVVTRGYRLVYEPAALLYHPHRRTYSALRKYMYGYGVGLTAYLTKILLDTPRLLFDLIPKLPHGLIFTLSYRSLKNSKELPQYPKELTAIWLRGMLYGPFAYMRSRWAAHRA
jgi:glycosyltransferase involved in cell wall biosynthesis